MLGIYLDSKSLVTSYLASQLFICLEENLLITILGLKIATTVILNIDYL